MMTVPVMYLFLQFIPETLAVISLNILLFSYSLKKYFPRILLAAILHSILIFVIWQLEIPQELRIVINSLIFGLTNWAVFRFAVLQVVAMSVIGLFTLFVTEYLSIIIAANFIFNVDPDVLIASPQYRTYIPYVHISVLVVLAYWFYRLKYRIKRPDLTGRKRYTGLLFIIGLIQIFFLLLLVETLTMYGTVDLFSVHRVPLHIMIVILMVVLSFVIIKKWYQYEGEGFRHCRKYLRESVEIAVDFDPIATPRYEQSFAGHLRVYEN